MPKTDYGWNLDDSKDFSPEQLEEIKKLINNGEEEKAKKLIEEIFS